MEIDASDLKNHPKANCIYQKLKASGTFKNVIHKFAGKNTFFDLDILVGNISIGNISKGWGTLNSSSNSSIFQMRIDQEGVLQRTPVETAITFLHQAIHAEMRRYLYGAKNHSTLPGFPGNITYLDQTLAKYMRDVTCRFY